MIEPRPTLTPLQSGMSAKNLASRSSRESAPTSSGRPAGSSTLGPRQPTSEPCHNVPFHPVGSGTLRYLRNERSPRSAALQQEEKPAAAHDPAVGVNLFAVLLPWTTAVTSMHGLDRGGQALTPYARLRPTKPA